MLLGSREEVRASNTHGACGEGHCGWGVFVCKGLGTVGVQALSHQSMYVFQRSSPGRSNEGGGAATDTGQGFNPVPCRKPGDCP